MAIISSTARGHCETWELWRRDRTVDPALRAIVRSYEYEDWPRGRIVFDRAHRGHKRLSLSEHRDAERCSDTIQSALKHGCAAAHFSTYRHALLHDGSEA
jgi:hypothetical protein